MPENPIHDDTAKIYIGLLFTGIFGLSVITMGPCSIIVLIVLLGIWIICKALED